MSEEEFNKRGIYTVIKKAPGQYNVLVLYHTESEPRELAFSFLSEEKADEYMKKHGNLIMKETPLVFKYAWDQHYGIQPQFPLH